MIPLYTTTVALKMYYGSNLQSSGFKIFSEWDTSCLWKDFLPKLTGRTRHWVRKEEKMEHENQIITIMKSNRNIEKNQVTEHSLLTICKVCASRKNDMAFTRRRVEEKVCKEKWFFFRLGIGLKIKMPLCKVFSSGLSSLWLTHTSEFHRWIFSGLTL